MGSAAEKERKLAVRVMYTQMVRDMDERNAAREAKKIADERATAAEARYAASWRSFAIFDFDVNVASTNDLHANIKTYLGEEMWEEARRIARLTEDDEDDDLAEVDESEDVPDEPIPEGMPTIREMVLAQLAEAGDKGTKAAAIRKIVEDKLGRKLHQKTIGMTLYRLSKDVLARSEGHTWFPVEAAAETGNPGAGTPGSIEQMLE